MNKLLVILIMSVLLTGCASFKEALCGKPDIIVPENKTIHVDPKLLEPCKKLIESTSTNPTFEDYLLLIGDNAIAYADCRNKQDASIKFIKQVGEIK